MRARVVDDDVIADIDLGQHAVNGEFIIVFAQPARNVIEMIAGRVLLAEDGDVVIGLVHGGAHEVGGAGVQTDVFLPDMLFVQYLCDEMAVGREHKTSELGEDGDVTHARGDEDILIGFSHALADDEDVVVLLFGAVGDAHAAREVDEGDVHARLGGQFHGEAEEDLGEFGVIAVVGGVAGEEGVDAEVLDAVSLELKEGLLHLFFGHAVFGVAGGVHDLVVEGEIPAGVIAAAHGLRKGRESREEIDVGEVVEIDDGVEFSRQLEIGRGGDVGGEHDLLSREADGIRQHELRQGRAVHAATFLPQDLHEIGVGGRLDGEIFLESLVPGERLFELAGVFADTLFVIDMERGGIGLCDFFDLFFGYERQFLHLGASCVSFFVYCSIKSPYAQVIFLFFLRESGRKIIDGRRRGC